MTIYFPLLASNKIYQTSTIVYNFPPNDFENIRNCSRFLSLIWIEKNIWKTKTIDELKPLEIREVFYDSIKPKYLKNNLLIMSITDKPLETSMNYLPIKTLPQTTPAWRSTINVHRKDNSASYQGEISPFPEKSTLLSFSTFLQKKENTKNYLIFMNLESKPTTRKGYLIFSTIDNPSLVIKKTIVKSNNYNLIDLNKLNIENHQIMVCYSKDICGIPLFFSFSDKNDLLSLEHTHPPSSLLIHGDRNNFQKSIKKRWFKSLYK